MKILQLVPTLGSGGAERLVAELSNELLNLGQDCSIATLYDLSKENNHFLTTINQNIKLFSLHKRSGMDLKCMFSLKKAIKQNGFQVVHVHSAAIPYIFLATIFCNNVKFVATIHSHAKREAGGFLGVFLRKIMFKWHLCQPITISEESNASFKEFYKFNADIIYNGISEYKVKGEIIHSNNNEFVLIHPASCQPVKNQVLLFSSVKRLIDEGVNIKLIWLGSNQTYENLFHDLSKFLSDKIIYKGVVDNVRDYLYTADAMCLSSRMEGMPMTIIEAFSVGCIPLCTPVGGCINMIQNGKNGFLSKDLSENAYYDMLKHFINLTKEKKAILKKNALASFNKYKINTTATSYLKIYNTIY